MNNKPKSKLTGKSPASGGCFCQGLGPMLSEFLRRLGPPESAREHFEAAQMEALKGLRAMLDACIEKRSGKGRKGEKIAVE